MRNETQPETQAREAWHAHLPRNFLSQIGALFGSVIFVHLFYLVYVRPTAEAQIAAAGIEGVPRTFAIRAK